MTSADVNFDNKYRLHTEGEVAQCRIYSTECQRHEVNNY